MARKRMDYLLINHRKFTWEERVAAFWDKVNIGNPDECWQWKMEIGGKGYPCFWNGEYTEHAHRFSLRLKLGRKLKKGEHALHTCDNPGCMNPSHLFPGTNLDNIADKMAKGRHRTPGPKTPVMGELHHKAKLNDIRVRRIRKKLEMGFTVSELAAYYNVTYQLIWMVRKGKIWKHLL